MNATEILVIILSSFLAIFLLVGIILAILLIKVTLEIRRVTARAEKASANVESFVTNLTATASKAAFGKIVLSQVKKFYKKRKGGKS